MSLKDKIKAEDIILGMSQKMRDMSVEELEERQKLITGILPLLLEVSCIKDNEEKLFSLTLQGVIAGYEPLPMLLCYGVIMGYIMGYEHRIKEQEIEELYKLTR